MIIRKSIQLGDRTLTLETGRVAKQANGAVLVYYGDNIVLCTAVTKDKPVEGQDFFPLSVDYREKSASVGRIPGGFFKREGRPSDKEILSARLIDRPIRPMFPDGYFCETQIICNVYSSDGETDADVIGAIGASAALLISDIPFEEPISEVRIAKINGEYIINPTYKQLDESSFDITVAGMVDSIVMVEGEAKEITEAEFIEAIKFAHTQIKKLCEFQKEFRAEAGKEKLKFETPETFDDLRNEVTERYKDKLIEAYTTIQIKQERKEKLNEIRELAKTELAEKYPDKEAKINEIIDEILREELRRLILYENRRIDGRGLKDIRPISCEISVLPRTHGSALFTRGETQSLTTLTLGTKSDQQIIEGLMLEENMKRFMLHYNFPPFSTGEVTARPGPTRREIGHGNLAERALKNLIPSEEEFPYTIRLVSDILESNGSSSMATVCAGSLALMDGGVKIKKPVAGIAMGLVKENDEVRILSDILGDEDHFGDMDFKVAGTKDGITAIQMDIKIKGISFEIMEKALEQAREGRLQILDIMNQTISTARDSISKYAPRLYTMYIPTDMIGLVIGPGGKTIRNIIQESKTEIEIENDGKVIIAATSEEGAEIAKNMIEKLTEQPEVGKVYLGVVKAVKDFGAFVEILPGKEGLLHISEIENRKISRVSDVLKVGQQVEVKLVGVDEFGKLRLSRKVLIKPEPCSDKPHSQKPYKQK